MQKRRFNNKRIWMMVLVLFICAASTTFALMNRLNVFMPDASGAVELTADTSVQQIETERVDDPQTSEAEYNFEVYDDEQVWKTETKVDIFRISYENGQRQVTVNGSNDEKVIAPGTENSYIFKMKNTGDGAVDYKMTVDAYCEPADIKVPVKARVSRYDGTWICGSKTEYVDVDALDNTEDSASLGSGNYTYYTLDWQWPYEQGADDIDTALGNLAAEQDITFTIKIKTVAEYAPVPDSEAGIRIPQTGDNFNTVLWFAIGGCMLLIMFLLLFARKNDDEEEEGSQA